MTFEGSPNRYRYVISSDMVNEGVTLTLRIQLNVRNNNFFPSTAWARFKNLTTGQVIGETRGIESAGASYGNINAKKTGVINFQYSIQPDQLVSGHRYIVEIIAGHPNITLLSTSTFRVDQDPIPNSIIPTTNLFTRIFNVLFTTQSSLVSFFDNPTTRQKDISGSGFNAISLPWSLQYGDEVRFEGDENKVWIVKDILVSSSMSIPYLAIYLDRDVPNTINVDEFLFRRYVNDASSILLEGYKPIGSTSPFILKPEYCSPALNKDIDQFILDLTEKGLL
jgi:hypothetical protein